jgi:CHRD domain-containing protein
VKQPLQIYSWYAVKAFLLFCFFALVTAGCGGGGGAAPPQAPINVSTLLTRAQENPLFTNFSSSGVGSVTVDPATRKISGVIGTLAHIHSGSPGVPGPVEIPLAGGPTVWTVPDGTILTLDQLAKFNAGLLYYNVHSARFPGGEIRGQLSQQVRSAALSGADETPPVTTAASGTGVLALDPVTRRVSGFVRTTGITGTQAHIHLAAAGVSGPVIIPLAETAAGSGIWAVPLNAALTAAQVASFNAGELYFNVHSAANPGGEIRGQIVPATLTVKTAQLSGAQETPAVTTSAAGSGIAVVNSVSREVFGDLKTAGVTGTIAHIHEGAAGAAGPVRVNLDQTAPGSGVWSVRDSDRVLTPALVAQFDAGNLYFNVHSVANPTGEIRGQINIAGPVFNLDAGAPPSAPAPPAPPGQPVVFPSSGVSFASHMQVIFNTYCIGCHTANGIGGFMPLTLGVSYANLVNVPAVKPLLPGTRVIPGDSANSVLYIRVSGVGLADQSLRMPQGGPFLDTLNPSAIPAIKAWIDEGAKNN